MERSDNFVPNRTNYWDLRPFEVAPSSTPTDLDNPWASSQKTSSNHMPTTPATSLGEADHHAASEGPRLPMRKEVKGRLLEQNWQQAPSCYLHRQLCLKFPDLTDEERMLSSQALSAAHSAAALCMETFLEDRADRAEISARTAYVLKVIPTSKVLMVMVEGIALGHFPQIRFGLEVRPIDKARVESAIRAIKMDGLEWVHSMWLDDRKYLQTLRIGLLVEKRKLDIGQVRKRVGEVQQVRSTRVVTNGTLGALCVPGWNFDY
ncbi:hypothetical protein H2199_000806 [Coniosporium tulheliwenetii]|uniref:Uncharacterized protein n=1 Tax=Coniosporium tulheliwenetii TaxID=3383036 RepID=A0ACC2ZMW5_9PEZI|nr:hypothetical protein H2199_000806 [Cladosporium sp. JES 115]